MKAVARECQETQTETTEETPMFTVPLKDLVIDEGAACRLEAGCFGVPTPTITWYKDGIPVASNSDYVAEQKQSGDCSLSIDESLREDSAMWTCRASNSVGFSESHARLTVREVPRPQQEHKPAFYVPLSNTTCNEKDNTMLECVIIGCPEPEVIWYQEDTPVREGPNCRLEFEGDACRLLLTNVELHQAGDYRVRAINHCGEVSSSCTLNVKESSSKKREEVPPKFNKPLQGCAVEEGQKIQLEGTFIGFPEPQVSWWKGSQQVITAGRVQVEVTIGKTSLTIMEANEEDADRYTCQLENTCGTIESATDVMVRKKGPRLAQESASLRTLASHRRVHRPLPDLLPFPFKPDPVVQRPRRNNSKVPKPSKFRIGEMYHSDYESDLEGRIPIVWRPSQSDSEEVEESFR